MEDCKARGQVADFALHCTDSTLFIIGIVRGSPQAGASNFCIIKTTRSLVYNYQPYHRTTRATTTTLVANGAAASDTCHHCVVTIPLRPIQLLVHIHATAIIRIPNFNLPGNAYTSSVQSVILNIVQIVIGPAAQTAYDVRVCVVDDSLANIKHCLQTTGTILGSIKTNWIEDIWSAVRSHENTDAKGIPGLAANDEY